MHKPLAMALTLALALPAAAADADARVKAVAPFLDEQTFTVVRLDLAAVDAAAVLKEFGPFSGIDVAGAKELQTNTDRWLADFKKAGGRDVYLVFSLADLPDLPFLIVPLPDGSDAKTLAALFKFHVGMFQGGEKLGDVVFAGSPAARDRLRTLKPVERPELAKAFAAARDGAAQVAIIPPPHLVRVFEEMMPLLPKEAGGGSGKVLTQGLRWAALGLDPPPKMALRLTVQSKDAAAAKAFAEGLPRMLKSLAEQKEVRAALPGIEKTAASLEPKVEDDRVVAALGERDTHLVLEGVVRRLVRTAAQRVHAAHLQELALAVYRYADEHKGQMPAVANFDKDGKPLLSWRVHLLPLVGEKKLYEEFHLDEPWDSEHNKKLMAKMPAVFRGISPTLNEQGKTVYLAPVGKDLAFTGKETGRRLPAEFSDGTSNTILLVEAEDARAVPWTKPEDLTIDMDRPSVGLGRQSGGFLFVLADGSVHFVKPTISKETLRAAFTANGGEVLGADWD
jgi:hypothetical protein